MTNRVLLWAGGVWHWLDALTPIRAVQRLREGGRPVHLVFLGTGRPALGDDVPIPTSAGEAVAFARQLGLAPVLDTEQGRRGAESARASTGEGPARH